VSDGEQAKILKACADVPAFQQLDDDECQQLLAIAQQRAFAPGEQVIEQGKRSQKLWILLEGKCEVIRHSEHDGPLVLAQLEPRSVFGEMSFFSPAPHSASVVAKTQVRLLSIRRMDYDELLASGNLAAYKVAYNVVQSLAHRLRRMDDWVAELTAGDKSDGQVEEKVPEWHEFRKKLFETWNL
jgi:CRP/FNR family transcriptional regulator, cyclic AMP receptor protein